MIDVVVLGLAFGFLRPRSVTPRLRTAFWGIFDYSIAAVVAAGALLLALRPAAALAILAPKEPTARSGFNACQHPAFASRYSWFGSGRLCCCYLKHRRSISISYGSLGK
jgi:hypothetical protein